MFREKRSHKNKNENNWTNKIYRRSIALSQSQQLMSPSSSRFSQSMAPRTNVTLNMKCCAKHLLISASYLIIYMRSLSRYSFSSPSCSNFLPFCWCFFASRYKKKCATCKSTDENKRWWIFGVSEKILCNQHINIKHLLVEVNFIVHRFVDDILWFVNNEFVRFFLAQQKRRNCQKLCSWFEYSVNPSITFAKCRHSYIAFYSPL